MAKPSASMCSSAKRGLTLTRIPTTGPTRPTRRRGGRQGDFAHFCRKTNPHLHKVIPKPLRPRVIETPKKIMFALSARRKAYVGLQKSNFLCPQHDVATRTRSPHKVTLWGQSHNQNADRNGAVELIDVHRRPGQNTHPGDHGQIRIGFRHPCGRR